MGLKVSGEEKREYEPIPEDTYVGTNVGILDVGKQWNPKYKVWRRKVIFMFEIPDVRAQFTFEGEDFDYPRMVSRSFGLTLSRKGHLRPLLEQWSGTTYSNEAEIDLKDFLGKAGLIQVVHSPPNADGRVYSNLGSVGKLLKGMEAPEPETKLMFFSFDEHESVESVEEVLQDFPEWIGWIVNQIRESAEYENLKKRSNPSDSAVEHGGDEPPF